MSFSLNGFINCEMAFLKLSCDAPPILERNLPLHLKFTEGLCEAVCCDFRQV